MDSVPSFGAPLDSLPWLTTAQMVEVDRAMVEDVGIVLMQMMEHAGRHLAQLARIRFLGGDVRGRTIAVLAGTGGNGGGALVGARRLLAWGARVTVAVTADDERFAAVPRHQLKILRRLGVPIRRGQHTLPATPDLVIDGLIGYSLLGPPRGDVAALVEWANAQPAPVLALDVPSGLDAATGRSFEPAIAASATLTLALPKVGLRASSARPLVGELYLADIGVPPQVYARPPLGLAVPDVFAKSELIRIW